jgi:hypothetical protein
MLWASSSFAASTKAVSTTPAEIAYEDRPLTSSALLPTPVLGRSPVEDAYAPGSWLDQHGNITMCSSTIVHCVQSLYINRYVSVLN